MSNPFSFKGRIGRIEFLIILIIYFASLILCISRIYHDPYLVSATTPPDVKEVFFVSILLIIIFWVMIFATTKRLHDLDNSGWWQILGYFFAFALPFFLLYLLLFNGDDKPNKYGEISGKKVLKTNQI